MSPHTTFHAPRTSLSGRIQIGHKSGFIIYFYLSVNIKPPRLRFVFSLAWGWQYHQMEVKLALKEIHQNIDRQISKEML